MSEHIEKINMFDISIPHDCLWCRYGGIVMTAEDRIEAVACLHCSTMKTQKKDRPPDRDVRTYLKIMESNETCVNCVPIKTTDDKYKVMRQLGVAYNGGD